MPVFSAEIGQKPQFMLNEEYTNSLCDCAILAIRKVAETIYPNNIERQQKFAEAIGKKAMDYSDICIIEEGENGEVS